MIIIISPATTMNFDKTIELEKASTPVFSKDVNYLISLLREFNINDISELMNLSEDLSKLNYDRYQNFSNENNKKLQSILAFDGEVFNSIKVSDFTESDFDFINEHLRILSGLYGVLYPFDLIEPYRLEMKAKLKNNCGNGLYKFWKSKITSLLIEELKNTDNKVLVNLASSEYLKCIDLKAIKKEFKFIDVVFKDYDVKSDTYKVKGLYAKKARGYMCRFIVKNKVDTIEDLLKFNIEGYAYNSELSNEEVITFTRKDS
ncbi:peroxide stress protein YaaA [Romboutsia sp. 13368]|uniref:peroxide stress protein YaaA n=1 Tax=Romboutsia sp. 13368 TaxID=2708053 RepID=UPI0025E02721|nr:peroxide stress protein YaaA [Romboutsia sp. 13368]